MQSNQLLLLVLFVSAVFSVSGAQSTGKGNVGNNNKEIRPASAVSIHNTKKYISKNDIFPDYYSESIRNITSDKPAYVTVDVYRLHNPGADKEELTELKVTDDAEIYVMPRQVLIPAGGSRAVRVYLTRKVERDRDRYYRIRFSPSPLQPEHWHNSSASSTGSSLFLGLGVGQLLMVGRTKPEYETRVSTRKEAKAGDNILMIENRGNSYVRINNMKTCFQKTLRKPCQYGGNKHVNAGATLSFPVSGKTATIDFDLAEGDRIRKVQVHRIAGDDFKVI